jgi:hypothetical protein
MRMDITIQFSSWRAVLWVRAMQVARYVVGTERAMRWALAGSWRLSRYRIGGGRWRSCAELRR